MLPCTHPIHHFFRGAATVFARLCPAFRSTAVPASKGAPVYMAACLRYFTNSLHSPCLRLKRNIGRTLLCGHSRFVLHEKVTWSGKDISTSLRFLSFLGQQGLSGARFGSCVVQNGENRLQNCVQADALVADHLLEGFSREGGGPVPMR